MWKLLTAKLKKNKNETKQNPRVNVTPVFFFFHDLLHQFDSDLHITNSRTVSYLKVIS